MQETLSEEKNEYYNYIKMCMIYKQCIYYILLLLCDFEWENVEIKQNLKLENLIYFSFLYKGVGQSHSVSNGCWFKLSQFL